MHLKDICLSIVLSILLFGCQDVINVDLQEAEKIWAVDAWIDTRDTIQVITIAQTQAYFDDNIYTGIEVDSVYVTNSTQKKVFAFTRDNLLGHYFWKPRVPGELGEPGDLFALTIVIGDLTLKSSTQLDSVPAIDSIWFIYEDPWRFQGPPIPEAYYLDFNATDFVGVGNTYWIKSYRNNSFRNRPLEINLAFDAAFSEGNEVDGVPFTAPIRFFANRIETNNDDQILSPLAVGDTVRIEIHSVSQKAYTFLFEFADYVQDADPFAQLFASPFSDVDTNIEAIDKQGNELKAYGFFNVAMISSLTDTLTEEKAAAARAYFEATKKD